MQSQIYIPHCISAGREAVACSGFFLGTAGSVSKKYMHNNTSTTAPPLHWKQQRLFKLYTEEGGHIAFGYWQWFHIHISSSRQGLFHQLWLLYLLQRNSSRLLFGHLQHTVCRILLRRLLLAQTLLPMEGFALNQHGSSPTYLRDFFVPCDHGQKSLPLFSVHLFLNPAQVPDFSVMLFRWHYSNWKRTAKSKAVLIVFCPCTRCAFSADHFGCIPFFLT